MTQASRRFCGILPTIGRRATVEFCQGNSAWTNPRAAAGQHQQGGERDFNLLGRGRHAPCGDTPLYLPQIRPEQPISVALRLTLFLHHPASDNLMELVDLAVHERCQLAGERVSHGV